MWKSDFPSLCIPSQFSSHRSLYQQRPLHLFPTPGVGSDVFTKISPSFSSLLSPSSLHLTLLMSYITPGSCHSPVICSTGVSLPHTFPADNLPNWNSCCCYPLSPTAFSAAESNPFSITPVLKVVITFPCGILASPGLMIASPFASSANFLCVLLLFVPRSRMQMLSRIIFKAETQGTVLVNPLQSDTSPFS